MILDSYDNNKDGIVTIDEISDDVVSCCMCKTNRNPEGALARQNGCCGCCAPCSKSFGSKVNFSQIFYAVDVIK